MTGLNIHPNLKDGDGFYAKLLAHCENLSEEETNLFFARLALVLANHIGDDEIVAEAIDLASLTDPDLTRA